MMIYWGDTYTLFVYKVNNTSYPKLNKVALLSKPQQTGIAMSREKKQNKGHLTVEQLSTYVYGEDLHIICTQVDFSIQIV